MTAGYSIRCRSCDARYRDDGEMVTCPNGCTGLLLSEYEQRTFEPDLAERGTFRYHRWLPVRRTFANAGSVAVFPASRAWQSALGYGNLWFAFSGYWPARGASLDTATFKELEAYAVIARLPSDVARTLVVASAGNTAAAFARICSKHDRSCAIVVPSVALARLRFSEPLKPCVTLIEIDGTYDDAIVFARRLAKRPGYVLEGGVRNVARRDGMGTAMLAAVEAMGRLPDMYVQAVGSGAGALAANEASERLIADGRFGTTLPRLMLSQNAPFAPMVDSWRARSAALLPLDPADALARIAQIDAHVLSNQAPPYAVAGGIFEALQATAGDMFGVDNESAMRASKRFSSMEGIDLEPAAAVALASLEAIAAVPHHRDQCVLVHLTGGGWLTHRAPHAPYAAHAAIRLDALESQTDAALAQVERLRDDPRVAV
jgi:cysteate synthase